MHINNRSTYEVNTSLAIIKFLSALLIGFALFTNFRPYVVLKEGLNMSDISYAVTKHEYKLKEIASSPHTYPTYHLEDTRTPEEIQLSKIYEAVNKVSQLYPNVERSLILAVIKKESQFNPNVNGSGAVGLMQIIPSCHESRIERLGVTDVYDIYSNILIGTDTLSELITKYKDVGLALMCYNMGEGGALYKYNNSGYSGYVYTVLGLKEEIERSESHGTNSRQEDAGSDSGNS